MQKNAEMLKKIYQKTDDTLGIFNFFIEGDWHFLNKRIYKLFDRMSPEEREEFNVDCKNYDWFTYTLNYMKGMSIWALKEDQIEPIHGLE